MAMSLPNQHASSIRLPAAVFFHAPADTLEATLPMPPGYVVTDVQVYAESAVPIVGSLEVLLRDNGADRVALASYNLTTLAAPDTLYTLAAALSATIGNRTGTPDDQVIVSVALLDSPAPAAVSVFVIVSKA